MTDVNRHGRETISAKDQHPPLRAALPDLEQRHVTNYTNAMTQIISIMPNPGGGTRIAGDTPQEVLFFATDGVEYETVNGSRVQSLRYPSSAPRSRIAESASPCSTRPMGRCRSATLEPAARLETCNGARRGAVAQPSKRGTALFSRRTAVGTFSSTSRPLRGPVSPV